jgi:hypothetical protein
MGSTCVPVKHLCYIPEHHDIRQNTVKCALFFQGFLKYLRNESLSTGEENVMVSHFILWRVDDRYPKLKCYIPELISDSYKYILVPYVTMHCMIWP